MTLREAREAWMAAELEMAKFVGIDAAALTHVERAKLDQDYRKARKSLDDTQREYMATLQMTLEVSLDDRRNSEPVQIVGLASGVFP